MESKYNFTLSGFIISLILVAMFSTAFGVMISAMNDEYSMHGNNTFAKYENYTNNLTDAIEDIRNATDIQEDEGMLDVIGGFFSSGYAAVKTSIASFNLFGSMMDDAAEDIEAFELFKSYLWMIVAIIIFVGVVIAVLVKMRI